MIFGPLGFPHRIHLIRDLRNVGIQLEINEETTYAIIRHRGRVQQFVDTINQHVQDDARKSLLKRLTIKLSRGTETMRYGVPILGLGSIDALVEKHITLEPLIGLPTMDNFTPVGLPGWFATCLSLRVLGEGGPLSSINWPVKIVKRKGKGDHWRADRRVRVSTRQTSQPIYDWQEFAHRNGIALPKDAERFFPSTESVSSGRVVA